jgi:hypothetical protein
MPAGQMPHLLRRKLCRGGFSIPARHAVAGGHLFVFGNVAYNNSVMVALSSLAQTCAVRNMNARGDTCMKQLLLLAIIGSLFVGTAFSQKNATLTKSGLKYVDLKVGAGDEAKMGMKVEVKYTGWLYVKGKRRGKFGTSGDRGGTLSFTLGTGKVVKGMEEGIAGMKVGGKRELFVPPDLGYGASGSGGVIPSNATLDFEVELVKVSK